MSSGVAFYAKRNTDQKIYRRIQTSASLFISHDTDVATVSGRLGHANANTTLKVYSHMFKARDRAAAQALGNIAFAVSEG